MIRVVELFAGIGAQASALERLGIPHERVAVAEFEPHAYNGYCAIHGDTPNLGDIMLVEHLPDCDLLCYSPPCQDISIAGNKKGLAEGSGTRSSMLWEVLRLLKDAGERESLPEVLVMENVDAILTKDNRPQLERFIIGLNELGYDSSWKVLNAKDFGVPQNRNRFFMVSTLDKGLFIFPKGKPLEKRLKDVLEPVVDESYYLSEEKLANYRKHALNQKKKGNGFGVKFIDIERERGAYGNDPSLQGCGEHRDSPLECSGEPDMTEAKIIQAGILPDIGHDDRGRVYDPNGIAPTIQTPTGGGRMPKIEVMVAGTIGGGTDYPTLHGL